MDLCEVVDVVLAGEWPEGVEYIAQDADGFLDGFVRKPQLNKVLGSWMPIGVEMSKWNSEEAIEIGLLADQWDKEVVSREEYLEWLEKNQ